MAGSGTRVTVDSPDKRGVPPGSAICGTEPQCAAYRRRRFAVAQAGQKRDLHSKPPGSGGWVGGGGYAALGGLIPRRPRPRIVSMRIWSLAAREPASGCPPSKPSGKVPDTHSVGSICDHDFGVFTVTNIATENTDAVPPAHPVPRMPKPANQGLQRCRGSRVSLTCLAPLTAWQSLCTGHVDASLENFVAGLHRREPPERR